MGNDKTQETISYKRAKRSALSQQVTTMLQGTDKTTQQRQTCNITKKTQKKHDLGTVSKKSLEGLNMLNSTTSCVKQYDKLSLVVSSKIFFLLSKNKPILNI